MIKNIIVKPYTFRRESNMDGKEFYILTFNDTHHVKVSDIAYCILVKFDGNKSMKQIVEQLNDEDIHLQIEDLEHFINEILIPNNMIYGEEKKPEKKNSRLWFHIPIVNSSCFNPIYKILNLLLNKFVVSLLISIIIPIIIYSFSYYFIHKDSLNMQIDSMGLIGFIYLSLLLHEFGHLTAAHHYNISSGKIGIGFYLSFLVVYVDMTNSWRLSKKERIVVDISGMYFQLLCIIPATFFYIISHNTSYLVVIIIIFLITSMNLFPFLRLDGYWVLCDWIGLQNVNLKIVKSIKTLVVEIGMKVRSSRTGYSHEVNKVNIVYGIYSVIYSVCSGCMLCYLLLSAFNIMSNYEYLVSIYNNIRQSILKHQFWEILTLFINSILYLMPIWIAIFILFSFCKGFLRSIVQNSKNK